MSSKKIPIQLPKYTLGEEIGNSITHGIGAALSIAGCVMAIIFAALYGDAWCVVSACIYGATLIIAYITSTLYHALTHVTAKKVFRVLDHTNIFLLIAGTYTPMTLVVLRGPLGWVLFGIVWGAAVVGIVLNAVGLERFKTFSMIAYIASGWAALIGIVPLYRLMDHVGFWMVVGGGIAYTLGVIFFSLKQRYMHVVWHVFVIAGSLLHYFAVLFYVLPIDRL
ncbi:MAG: hemolysin III family protein [Clostridia bacterium]|nr:hemolysin III family protein [Clostridia bacterium]